MATGISLHLGLNAVDPHDYEGWSGHLAACEYDAKDMQAIFVDAVVGKPGVEGILEVALGLNGEAEQREFCQLVLD